MPDYDTSIKPVKIGDKVIVIDDKKEDIDLSNIHVAEEVTNIFQQRYDKDFDGKISTAKSASIFTKKPSADIGSEADMLYSDVKMMSNENGEITDEKVKEFMKNNSEFKGLDVRFFKEFLIQALAPEISKTEKQAYFDRNKKEINEIKEAPNLLNKPSFDKNAVVGKDIVKTFKERYGEPYSPSMQMLVEKEYYKTDSEAAGKIYNIRAGISAETKAEEFKMISDAVKKGKVANCQEDAALTCLLLKEKYPEIVPYMVSYNDESGLSDKTHVAVMFYGDGNKEPLDRGEYGDKYKSGDELPKYKGGYVVDNWLGGVYKAEDWIKMQEKMYKSEAFNISTEKIEL